MIFIFLKLYIKRTAEAVSDWFQIFLFSKNMGSYCLKILILDAFGLRYRLFQRREEKRRIPKKYNTKEYHFREYVIIMLGLHIATYHLVHLVQAACVASFF